MVLLVGLVAGLARVVRLADWPPGFREEEATNALFAQLITGERSPIFFTGRSDAQEPLFVYLVSATGRLADWGIDGPRLAAALLGTLAAVACALWYRRALGPWWGLAGGLLVATSFWQLVYSRQAIAPIAMAACAALGLWCLSEVLAGPRPYRLRQLGWFAAAGIAFGAGFYADLAFRFTLPALLVIAAYLVAATPRRERRTDWQGPAIMVMATALAIAPLASWYLDNPEAFRRGFELAGGFRSEPGQILREYAAGLGAFVWTGPGDPTVSQPGRALLDPLVAAWAVAGLVVALGRLRQPNVVVALLWLASAALPLAFLQDAGSGALLAATPVVFFFPLLAARSSLEWLASRGWPRVGPAVAGLAVLTLAASAGWSLVRYVEWAESDETWWAFRGDVRAALDAAGRLPDPGRPVYYSVAGAARVTAYLAPERPARLISQPDTLVLPIDARAWLVVPASTGDGSTLTSYLPPESLVQTGQGPGGEAAYRVWLVDPRSPERLPWVAPAVAFENGFELAGYAVQPAVDGPPAGVVNPVLVTLVWRVPTGKSRAVASARLQPADAAPVAASTAETAVVPWRSRRYVAAELVVTTLVISFPESPVATAWLEIGLRDSRGEPVQPATSGLVVTPDGHVLVDHLAYQPDAP